MHKLHASKIDKTMSTLLRNNAYVILMYIKRWTYAVKILVNLPLGSISKLWLIVSNGVKTSG